MMRPPSSMVGTTPFGFIFRYQGWSLPPNAMPTSTRSYFTPHSSAAHSTFMTLIEFARPQIFIATLSLFSTFPLRLAADDPNDLFGCRIVGRIGRLAPERRALVIEPRHVGPHALLPAG